MHSRAKVAAVAFGAALSLTGCSLAASLTTSNEYDASDGTGAVIGDVRTHNFLLVTSGLGEQAVLIGTVSNGGDDAAVVTIAVGEEDVKVKVPGDSSVTIGLGDGQTRLVTTADAAPGRLASVDVSVTGTGSETKPLPVVDGTLPEYQAVLDELAELG